MKFLLLSDLHLCRETPQGRKDNIFETEFKKLSFVFDYAKKNDCIQLWAGDIFDTPRSWYILSSMISFFNSLGKYNDVFVILGQHDMYMRSEDTDSTTFGVLYSMGFLHLLKEKPMSFFGKVNVYGASFGQDVPKANLNEHNILVIHKMIVDIKLWKDQQNVVSCQNFLMNNSEYDLIVCGDAHQRFIFVHDGRIICNSGPLLRLEASKEMYAHEPGFFVYDSDTRKIQWVMIPHSKAEDVLSRIHIETKEQVNETLEKFIQSMTTNDNTFDFNFVDNLMSFMEKNTVSNDVRKVISNVMIKEK